MQEDRPIVLHQGIYRPVATLSEAIFMITGMTIGAGVLGVPYAIAQVGVKIGVLYIIALGAVMLMLNLMVGEIVSRTKESLQLPGLAHKYLGVWGRRAITCTFLGTSLGAVLAYLIGEGQTLYSLFGGSPLLWTVLFWIVGMALVAGGLRRVKKYERVLSCFVISSLIIISLYLLSVREAGTFAYHNFANLFVPYGVILFALHATPSIAEAEAVLPNQPNRFKKAIIIGTLIPVALYILFAVAVVGVKGINTTEVATLGLTRSFGLPLMILGNVFAAVAMATAFMGITTALTDSLVWDYKVKRQLALASVALVPLLLFFVVGTGFIAVLEFVGGLFVGVEAILIALMFMRARTRGDVAPGHFVLRHLWFAMVLVMLVFTVLTLNTVYTTWLR